MASFFEKLKKGMGIEGPAEEKEEKPSSVKVSGGEVEKIEEKLARKKKVPKAPKESKLPTGQAKKLEVEAKPPEVKMEKLEVEKPKIERKEVPVEKVEEKKPAFAEATAGKEKWPEPEGQLAIDVYQSETELVIQSAIAGVKPENLDISMERDIIAIKGIRQKPFEENGDYFTQECYWGPFSREVILPVEIDPDRAEATMKDGILTIRIPKILREKKRLIKVRI